MRILLNVLLTGVLMVGCSSLKFSKKTQTPDTSTHSAVNISEKSTSTNNRQPTAVPLLVAGLFTWKGAVTVASILAGVGIGELISEYSEGSDLNKTRYKLCVADLYTQKYKNTTLKKVFAELPPEEQSDNTANMSRELEECPSEEELYEFCYELGNEMINAEEQTKTTQNTLSLCSKIIGEGGR